MGHPLSCDLRDRALAAVDAGLSRRAAAERFGVSAASVIRWDQLRRVQGHARPRPQGGDKTSHRIEAHAEVILEAVRRQPDITLKELRSLLAGRGVSVAVSTLWRFFHRRGITLKKRRGMPPSRTVPTS
jgi:transposase